MSSARTIAKNTGFLFTSEVISKLLSFFLVVVITRHLGDVGYGQYSFAFAFVSLIVVIGHFGMPAYLFRELSKKLADGSRLLGQIFTLRLGLLLVVFLGLALLGPFLPRLPSVVGLLLLVMVHEFFVAANSMLSVVFKAFEKNEYVVYGSVLDKGLALLWGFIALAQGFGVQGLVIALIGARFLSFLYHFLVCHLKFLKIRLTFTFSSFKGIFRDALPFWFTIVFQMLYFHIDKVMLTAMSNYGVVGWYSAASTLIGALTFIPVVISHAIFPAMSRFHDRNVKEHLQLLYRKSFYFLLLIGIPASIGISLLADRFILFIYQEAFAMAGPALQILSWGLVFVFVMYVMGYLLNSIDKQSTFSLVAGFSAVVNIVANLILIPRYSYIGAAYATLFSHGATFFLLLYFCSRNGFRLPLFRLAAKPLLAGAAMGGVIIWLAWLPIIVMVPLAIAIYGGLLFVMKGFGQEEVAVFKSFLPKL